MYLPPEKLFDRADVNFGRSPILTLADDFASGAHFESILVQSLPFNVFNSS